MYELFEEIAFKIRLAITINQVWFLDMVQQVGPGKPLPYDKRLGVTEEEYEFFIGVDEYWKLMTIGETVIDVHKSDSSTELSGAAFRIAKRMVLNYKDNTITTEFGELPYKSEIVPSDGQTLTGRWAGHVWRLEKEMEYLQISIGQHEESGNIYIYIKKVQIGSKIEEFYMLHH
ncbi:hypothetical protein DUZ99_19715 [Xylanibacillus composti]|nr:hypothetical protein [Xylanibacillus composti]